MARRILDGLIDETIVLLRDLLRIDTTNPGSAEAPAAFAVQEFLTSHGVQSAVFEPEKGRISITARVAGTNALAPSLLLLSHLDVVPAGDPQGWNHGSFSGDMSDGFIHGRGAIDDKGRTAINAASIVSLFQDPAPGDVLFVAAADEEEGGALGVRWLVDHHPETVGADFAVGEGGGYRTSMGDRDLYTYAIAEKGAFRLRLTFGSGAAGGHASIPGAENPAEVSARVAADLVTMRWPWTRSDATSAMLRTLSAHGPALRRAGQRALGLRFLGPALLSRGVGMSETQRRALHAMFHTTVALTSLQSGHAEGGIPQEAEALFSVRYPPSASRDQVLAAIRNRLRQARVEPEISVEREVRPRATPPTSPLATAFTETMAELDPAADLIPVLLPASTDLRDLDPRTVAYGFTPMRGITADEVASTAHGSNERIAVGDIGFGIEATVRTAHNLGKPSDPV